MKILYGLIILLITSLTSAGGQQLGGPNHINGNQDSSIRHDIQEHLDAMERDPVLEVIDNITCMDDYFITILKKYYAKNHKYPTEDEIINEVRVNNESKGCPLIISGSSLVDKWNYPVVYKYHSSDYVEIIFIVTNSQSDKPEFMGLKFNSGNIEFIDE